MLAVAAALWWGERFLVPVTAGLMLVMLVAPLSVWLERHLRSRTLATLLTLILVVATLLEGAMVFGGQLVRVAERTPEMISMAAQQLADREPGADSVLTRAREALRELDRAADRVMSNKPSGAIARAERPQRRPQPPRSNKQHCCRRNRGVA